MTCVLDEGADYAIEPGLHVRDIDTSLKFWRDTLGFQPYAEIDAGYCRVWGLSYGNSMVKLLQDVDPPATANPRERSIGFRYLTIHVLNAEEMVERCRSRGYEVRVEPFRFHSEDGSRECTAAIVYDPDGNWVEFSEGSPWAPPSGSFSTMASE